MKMTNRNKKFTQNHFLFLSEYYIQRIKYNIIFKNCTNYKNYKMLNFSCIPRKPVRKPKYFKTIF